LELKNANVRWFLSTDTKDLPYPAVPGAKTTLRSITVGGKEIEFTEGFSDLHTRVYEQTLQDRGFGIEDARPAIELVHRIRTSALASVNGTAHSIVLQSISAYLEQDDMAAKHTTG